VTTELAHAWIEGTKTVSAVQWSFNTVSCEVRPGIESQ
jgi:hypothetical protein